METRWAKNDSHRWKQLAVLTLVGNGWGVPNIARTLGLHKGHVYRILARARERVFEFAQGKRQRHDYLQF